jgi:MFS family permease
VGSGLSRLLALWHAYPTRFWLLFAGVFCSVFCSSFIWPFTTIFIAEQTQSSLTLTTLMFSVEACASLLSVGKTSKMMDLYGRKVMMITGLVLQAGNLLLMTQATSSGSWLVLMAVMGMASPLFSIGGNAMVADLLPNPQRAQAYALLRMAINLGVVTGPLIGCWIIAEYSFQTAFWTTASLLLLLAGLAHWFLQETRPEAKKEIPQSNQSVWNDRHFITILLFYTFSVMGFIEMFILMPIYLKQNFQILENQSSLLFSMNALIVVLFQYTTTRWASHFSPFLMMAVGALIYAFALGSIPFLETFVFFVGAMMVLTIGEMVINPTVTSYVSNLAPDQMRARYMGMLEMVYRVAMGISPLVAGLINDLAAPSLIWVYGSLISLLGATGFIGLYMKRLRG